MIAACLVMWSGGRGVAPKPNRNRDLWGGGEPGVCEELNAGQGGLRSWEGKSKGKESREQPGAEAFSRSLPVLLLLSEL